MTSDNCDDFMNVVKLAEKYSVSFIELLVIKPDSKNQLKKYPNHNQILKIAKEIMNYTGPVKIIVERCFPQLIILLDNLGYKSIYNNIFYSGCTAAKEGYNISVNGKYTPCRHLNIEEDFPTLDDYLEKSEIVKKLNESRKEKRKACQSCKFNTRLLTMVLF